MYVKSQADDPIIIIGVAPDHTLLTETFKPFQREKIDVERGENKYLYPITPPTPPPS